MKAIKIHLDYLVFYPDTFGEWGGPGMKFFLSGYSGLGSEWAFNKPTNQ
jgi:hypothetical protein